MEYRIVNGKKATSEIFYVIEEDQLYLKKNVKNNSVIYLKCYYTGCDVTGKVKNEQFFHVNHGSHKNHNQSVASLLREWIFFDELRNQCTSSTNPLKMIFDDVYKK